MSFFDRLSEQQYYDKAFYSSEFRQIMFDHIDHILKASQAEQLDVSPALALKHRDSLKGLLAELGIPAYLHWICMKINNIDNDFDKIETIRNIIKPNTNYIDNLFNRWASEKK